MQGFSQKNAARRRRLKKNDIFGMIPPEKSDVHLRIVFCKGGILKGSAVGSSTREGIARSRESKAGG